MLLKRLSHWRSIKLQMRKERGCKRLLKPQWWCLLVAELFDSFRSGKVVFHTRKYANCGLSESCCQQNACLKVLDMKSPNAKKKNINRKKTIHYSTATRFSSVQAQMSAAPLLQSTDKQPELFTSSLVRGTAESSARCSKLHLPRCHHRCTVLLNTAPCRSATTQPASRSNNAFQNNQLKYMQKKTNVTLFGTARHRLGSTLLEAFGHHPKF